MKKSRWGRLRDVAIELAVLVVLSACGQSDARTEGCEVVQPPTPLPDGLEETSGVAVSRRYPGVIWSHNDSGSEPELVAFRRDEGILARVPVGRALANDWEDLALASCAAGTRLYVGDTGDGAARRDRIVIYRFPEPDPTSGEVVEAEFLPARYPGGPRDTEAIFVLPQGEIYLVTKGRAESVELYRYPAVIPHGEPATLELVRTLTRGAQPLEEQVTGASTSLSGEWVAIRTYKRLRIWRTPDLLGSGSPAVTVDLQQLGEVQGEAVALLDNGGVVLTSEGGFPGARGTLAVLQCWLES